MHRKLLPLTISLAVLAATSVWADGITSPKEQFGFDVGADYELISYAQLVDYWKKLDRESDRMKLVEIGKTAEGRTMLMAIITSPQNHKKLDRYKEISRRLALAEGVTEREARALASEGRAVVWIDGGLHATEAVNAQTENELVYQMLSRNDAEVQRYLKDVILLTLVTNPDGMDFVAEWFYRETDPPKRNYDVLPRLYQKYVGHDNNRDSYMVNMPETEAMNRVLYREWFPQIVYNQHQTGPAGSIIFVPPFRDPVSYNVDPLLTMSIDLVGAAMHSRYIAEDKPGTVLGREARYQTWWNGCVRCTPYFHNMIGLLTELKGKPYPIDIPFIPSLHRPYNDYPYPIAPQKWHFRQSVDYVMTANYAVLDTASKHREDFLFNIYRMGMNSVERGSRDHWTIDTDKIAAVEAAIEKDKAEMIGEDRSRGYPLKYYEMFHTPEQRDPRGFILPSDQPDFLTATKFVNTLLKNGVTVHRATQSFQVAGKTYPAGSYVVKTAQAFRPHVMDMFEPQVYPNDFQYPGGPPKPPYDNAGYTLAFQMGVAFDRILEGFDGPFEKIEDLAKPPAGEVAGSGAAGFLLDHRANDAFVAINRLLANGEEVYWLKDSVDAVGGTLPPGTIYIPAGSGTGPALQKMADEIGLRFEGVDSRPTGEAYRLKPVRIGLWDQYEGSMPSGWVRWMFEQYEFPFEVVYPPALDAGGLADKYDVLVFVTEAIPERGHESARDGYKFPDPQTIPAEYRNRLADVSVSETLPELRKFLDAGGAILTIGSSTELAYHMNLALADALVETGPDGTETPLPEEIYYVPGSVLRASVDTTNPVAYGMPERIDVFFDQSPVFRILPDSVLRGVRPVAWFEKNPLRSGWAWGEHYLEGGAAVVEADVGRGKLLLFGPEITNRGQPHGTFKFLFNGIYYGGGAEPVSLGARATEEN